MDYRFAFDVRPQTGELRVSLRLAERMFERGHTVYYNLIDSPVFRKRLTNRGILLVKYPWDLWLSTPDLVLLDPALRKRADVYRHYGSTVAYIAAQREPGEPWLEEADGDLWIHLPPLSCKPFSHSPRQTDFVEEIKRIKEQRPETIVIGVAGEGMSRCYRILDACARHCPNFRIILSIGKQRMEEVWFAWPENISIYRQQELQPLLPLCDLMLTDENCVAWMDCVFACVPTWQLSANDQKRLTPSRLERRIHDMLADRPQLVERQKQLRLFYREQNRQLDTLINRLGDYLKQNQPKET